MANRYPYVASVFFSVSRISSRSNNNLLLFVTILSFFVDFLNAVNRWFINFLFWLSLLKLYENLTISLNYSFFNFSEDWKKLSIRPIQVVSSSFPFILNIIASNYIISHLYITSTFAKECSLRKGYKVSHFLK